MGFETILLEHTGGVSTITLNRPPMNAVSEQLVVEVLEALNQLEHRAETRCIVLTGGGTKAFCAGADLKAARNVNPAGESFRDLGRRLVDRLEMHPKPVIGAIRGWCIGGGFAIGMACDVRLASSTAKFRTGDAYLGVVPSWGMSLTRLVHFIGRNRALDLLILGEDIDAKLACEMGLVTKVIPDELFDAEVAKTAARVAEGSPLIYRAVKETMRAQYVHSPLAAQALETHWGDIGTASEDFKEGTAAFRERRKPVFTGR
jgi:enoyl-CoA hydratase/carnithine racemase